MCRSISRSRAVRSIKALLNAEFEPDGERSWRWKAESPTPRTVVKFELLADLDDVPAQATVEFAQCDHLGAVNLRGTGYASRDVEVRLLSSRVGGVEHAVEMNVAGLAGCLLAKSAAAHSRRKTKDWYDIAFVLLHNDAGGPDDAAQAVLDCFGADLPAVQTALDDLLANFAAPGSQGPEAYAEQMMIDHPGLDRATLVADAVIAVETFHGRLFPN